MQVLQAGSHKLLLLELDNEMLEDVARQAGFESELTEDERQITLELDALEREGFFKTLRGQM